MLFEKGLISLVKKNSLIYFLVFCLFLSSCSKELSESSSTMLKTSTILKSSVIQKMEALNVNNNYTSQNILVMDNNYDLVFLGSMFEGKKIVNEGSFNPIFGYQKLPIRVSSSLPGSKSQIISLPRLSTFRQVVQDMMLTAQVENADIGSFLFYNRPFQDYNELAYEFGYKLDTRSLFSSSTSNVGSKFSKIVKKEGIIAGFELVNFTIDMALPNAKELIDINEAKRLLAIKRSVPIYISSISYGQKGVFAIETNNSYESTTRAFEKVTRKIFKGTTEILTSTEIKLINESTIRVYLVGGSSGGIVVKIDSYQGFLNYIRGLGDFSKNNPGYPISFRCRKLEDFSVFKGFNN